MPEIKPIIIAPHAPAPLPEWLAEHGMRLVEARPLGYIAAGWVAGWSAGWVAALQALTAEGWVLTKPLSDAGGEQK